MRKLKHIFDIVIVGCLAMICAGFALLIISDMIMLKIIGLFMALVFTIYAFLYLYHKMYRETNIIFQLKTADKGNMFKLEIGALDKYLDSLELHKEQFENYSGDIDSMKEAYQIIYNQVYKNTKYIMDYIRHYDYITKPDKSQVSIKIGETKALIEKLNELDTLYVELDNTTGYSDVQRVDDLLAALREIIQ